MEAILASDALAPASRKVTVKLFEGMFDAASGRPEEKALAIIVRFESGPAVELTPNRMEGEEELPAL